MSVSNYGQLQTAVAAYADRSDLAAFIPDFIRTAHDEIIGKIVIGADLTFTTSTVSQPDDFRQVSSIWVDSWPKRPLMLANTIQTQSNASGVPGFYRLSGSDIIVAPIPDQTYTGKILYKVSRAFFADDSATNVILTKYPTLYIYAARKALAAYLHDAEAVSGFNALVGQMIEDINEAERGDVMDGPLQASPSNAYGVAP